MRLSYHRTEPCSKGKPVEYAAGIAFPKGKEQQ
jgi:hypothetical protein